MSDEIPTGEYPRRQHQYEGPDAHGQAAIILVESLLHALLAKAVFDLPEAIDVLDVAVDVKQEIADDLGDSQANLEKSLAILHKIKRSLANDVDAPEFSTGLR